MRKLRHTEVSTHQGQDSNPCCLAPEWNYSSRWWLCPSPLHGPWAPWGQRLPTFFTATPPVPSPEEIWGAELCILPKVIHLLRGRAGLQPRPTLFWSPCNFHHSLKLPGLLGEEHLGAALQKLKCLEKKGCIWVALTLSPMKDGNIF